MATFFTDLFDSIFTPGPTPTIVKATNASFAALQVVLFVLLVLTYSVHFIILSCLSAGLWWAINWFVREVEAANRKEKAAAQLREEKKEKEERIAEDSGTETEGGGVQSQEIKAQSDSGNLSPEIVGGDLRKRRSLGEASSGDLSTDSEWDKVEEAGEMKK